MNKNKKFLILDWETEEHPIIKWVTLSEILAEINGDRSQEWTDYDETDWEEGLVEWTHWRIIPERDAILSSKKAII